MDKKTDKQKDLALMIACMAGSSLGLSYKDSLDHTINLYESMTGDKQFKGVTESIKESKQQKITKKWYQFWKTK